MMNKMMKKLAVLFTVGALSVAGTCLSANANDGMGISTMDVSINGMDKDMYVRPAEGCNVRMAPSTDSAKLATYACNEKLHVVGKTTNGWYEIIVKNPVYGGECSGFIAGNLLSETKSSVQNNSNENVNPKYPWIKETNSAHSSQVKEERGWMSHDNDTMSANVSSGYLALRSNAVTDPENEIAQLSNGTMVQVQEFGSQFDYVYVPSLDMYGYVNNDYLAG